MNVYAAQRLTNANVSKALVFYVGKSLEYPYYDGYYATVDTTLRSCFSAGQLTLMLIQHQANKTP